MYKILESVNKVFFINNLVSLRRRSQIHKQVLGMHVRHPVFRRFHYSQTPDQLILRLKVIMCYDYLPF